MEDRQLGSRNSGITVPVKYKDITQDPQKILQQLEFFDLIWDSINIGLVVTDHEGYIIFLNKLYGKILGVDPKLQVGKHATEVIENTRIPIVAKTGISEINQTQRIKGHDMVVHRVPIKYQGKVIAVLGQIMFKNVNEVAELARKLANLKSKIKLYKEELFILQSSRYSFNSIIGVSKAITRLKKEASIAAINSLPVLIAGESGTGKGLFARAIHCASNRKRYPFVQINCANIPRDLMESELFGYEKGAFTGAKSIGKPGKLELAQYGTVFLDEIGDLPLEMQPKLLSAIEEKEFSRVGGNTLIKTDFRLLCATNQNIEAMMEDGLFRKDLYYRVDVIRLYIPPLRERKEDIVPVAYYLLNKITKNLNYPRIKIDPKFENTLTEQKWMGNVRELSNVLERAVHSIKGDTIYSDDLLSFLLQSKKNPYNYTRAFLKNLQNGTERKAVHHALESTDYNKARAAEILGIHRTHLYKKMRKYKIPLRKGSDYSQKV